MRLRQGSVERYRDALGQLGEQAAEYVATALATTAETDVAALREIAIGAISDAIGVQGSVAQALAMQLYDAICMAEGIDTNPAVMFPDAIDRDMLVEKVHYYARDLVMGAREKFNEECAKRAEFYVRRCAYENTVRNCGANNVRYARIPAGGETCDFCLMLASRGFVYHSEATAKGSHGVHAHCRCIVMPGVQGRTKIEGYDPDELYTLWSGNAPKPKDRRQDRHEPSMSNEDSAKMQRRLLKGLSKADRDQAISIIANAYDEWGNETHSIEADNHFANRVRRAMVEHNISMADIERAR